MGSDHDRYAELAVGHVLGGLSHPASAQFRSHLIGCADCRTRVAELRGIAADLAAAEQDERSRVPLRTEVERREPEGDEQLAPTGRLTVGHVTLAAVVVLIIAAAVGFWNLHLRTLVNAYDAVTTSQSEALAQFASGTPVPVELADGMSGLVVVDADQITFSVAGLQLDDADVVVAWTLDAQGQATEVSRAPSDLVREGNFAGVAEREGVAELLVTKEPGDPQDEPSGASLARSEIPTG